MDDREHVGRKVLDAAMKVHSELGPGLLESAYEACLAYELECRGASVIRQMNLPVRYGGVDIEAGYRLDLLVDNCVIVELKTVENFLPVHLSQMLTYLKLGDIQLGYLLNFNVQRMKEGIKRVVLNRS